MQIRTLLTLRFFAIAAGILALVLAYVYGAYKTHTESVFFEGLEAQASLVGETTLQEENKLRPLPPTAADFDNPLPYRENVSIFNDAYQRVFAIRPDAEPVTVRTLQEVQDMGECRFKHRNLHGLGVVKNSPSGRPYVVVAEGFCDPTGLVKLRNILIFSFLIGVGVVAVAGWYFAGQALAPVNQIVNQVDKIMPTDLSRRVEQGPNPDELGRLAETFNNMLDRVERAFQMQRQFLSNVSHELKNPLTVIRTQLDVTLQRERSPQEYRAALMSVLDDIAAIAEVEEKLLQLAKVHSEPSSVAMTPIRLDEVVWSAREQVLRTQTEAKVAIEFLDMPDDHNLLFVNANEALLRTALVNLMENGCKFSPDRRVFVRIIFKPSGDHVVEVHDKGPGISTEEKTMIFQPFFRSSKHREIKGTGIGLSLTDSILRLHGVELSVENVPEGGAVFRMAFGKQP